MKKRNILVFSLVCFLLLSLTISLFFSTKIEFFADERNNVHTNCSIFTVKDDSSVFFGNNEDEGGDRIRTDMWFVPPDDDQSYGCVYVGFAENEPGGDDVDGIEIGGMNTEGLCFDGNEILPGEYVNPLEGTGQHYSYLTSRGLILRECATVAEVIQWYQTHNMEGTWWGQTHWADKTGDAVVVSPATDGSIAFTRINGSFLISTNFNVDHPGGTYYPCPRYIQITAMLEGYISIDNVSVESCAQILESVHVPEGYNYAGTVYSNVYDLKQQLIYLYIHGNYEEVVVLDLTTELAKGYHGYEINNLEDSSSEELYPSSNLWPIEPKTRIYSKTIIIILVTSPIIFFTGYWVYITRYDKNEKKGGKTDGN